MICWQITLGDIFQGLCTIFGGLLGGILPLVAVLIALYPEWVKETLHRKMREIVGRLLERAKRELMKENRRQKVRWEVLVRKRKRVENLQKKYEEMTIYKKPL